MTFLPSRLGIPALGLVLGCTGRPLVDADDGGETSTGGGSASIGEGTTQSPTSAATTTSAGSSASVTITVGDESSSSPDSDSNPFLPYPDAQGLDIECDIWKQDCPRGEKCMPWANDGGNAWNSTRCSPLAPDPRQPGESCTVEGSGVSGIDDCELGAMCWGVDPETLMGTCVALCTGSEAEPLCESACESCTISSEGPLILCLPYCDPIAQDCSEGDACYPINDSFYCAPDAGAEAGALGDPCEFVNVCDPGLFCASPELVPDCNGASGCCMPYCDAAAADTCDALVPGTACVPWYEEGEGPQGCATSIVGACVLP